MHPYVRDDWSRHIRFRHHNRIEYCGVVGRTQSTIRSTAIKNSISSLSSPSAPTIRRMVTPSYTAAAHRPVSLALRASLLMTVIATFSRPAEAVLSVNATPEYIHSCRKSDVQFNSCIKETFNHLRPYLIEGIEELTVPPIEPLVIPKMQMENGHGAVRVRAILSNMTIHGASNYTVLNVRSDMNKYRIDLGLFIPHIEATGNYDVNGNVLLLPVRSRGEFWASFGNVTALAKLYGVEVNKEGVKFMKTERLGIGFKLEKSDFKIKDSINMQNVIGEAMNVFLNENSAEIIEEMKPAASQAIGKHFKNFLNNAFLQIPLKVWLKDSE